MIFFFIVGSGMIVGATGGELAKVGMISALVGLFSDKAIKKLSDILDVLLATKDDRKDKVTDTKQQTSPQQIATAPTTSAGGPPKVVASNPASIPPNTPASVHIKGSNFTSGLTVKVNGRDAIPADQTSESLKVEVLATEAQPPKVTITVTTDHGTAAFDLPVQ